MPTVNRSTIAYTSAVLLALTALAPLALTRAGAQPFDDGLLLSLPASAAHLGRGTVSSFGAMDASDVSRFTVNSALADAGMFLAGQTQDRSAGGSKIAYGAAALPVIRSGAVGFFTQSVPREYYEWPIPVTFGFSFARYYEEYKYGIGGHLSLTDGGFPVGGQKFYAGFGLDVRLDPTDEISWRVYFLNPGVPARRSDSPLDDRLADQYGLIINYRPWRDALPDFLKIDFGAGVQQTGYDPLKLGVSSGLGVHELFFLRLGYENSVDDKPRASGLSAGVGVVAGNFGVDVGYRPGSWGSDDGTLAVSARLHLESLKKRSAAANLSLARDYYGRGRFDRSLFYAKRALAADSAQWNARAVINRSEEELSRERGRDVVIIYGGNARGRVIPYPPSADALGGLSRHAAVIRSLRAGNPVNFTFDLGNILSEKNNELRIELAADYYNLMNFDAVAPGEGEIAMGALQFAVAQKRIQPIIITNLRDNNPVQTGIQSSLLLTNDDYSVYVMNLIARSALGGRNLPGMAINTADVRARLTAQRAAGASLRVAVIHGDMAEIRRLAEALPEIDVIIAGGLEQKLETPLRIGQTIVVSAGVENRFVGALTLKFDDRRRGRRFTASNRLHPVYQSVVPDSAVESVSKLVSASVLVDEGYTGYVPVLVRGVFPYISDRGEGSRAFIKALQSRAEYPLGEEQADSRGAVFSPIGNRAAFIFGKPDDMNGRLRIVDLATLNGRTAASGGNVTEAVFSPVNDFLYYIEADSGSDRGAIYKTKMYMYESITVLERDGAPRRDLSVSPDGTTLLYCSKGSDNRWQIFAIDSSVAAAPARLTSGNADHRYPRFSQNGRYIAYLSDRNGFGGRKDLWVFERGSGKHRQVTTNTNVRDFTWDGESGMIYFSAGINIFELYSAELGEEVIIRRLIAPPRSAAKTWSENTPRFIRYNNEDKILYTRENIYQAAARQIYWYDITSRREEKVYSAGNNNEWLD